MKENITKSEKTYPISSSGYHLIRDRITPVLDPLVMKEVIRRYRFYGALVDALIDAHGCKNEPTCQTCKLINQAGR